MIIKYYNHASIQHEMLGLMLSGDTSATQDQIHDMVGLFAVGRMFHTHGAINRNHRFFFRFEFSALPTDWNTAKSFDDAVRITACNLWKEAGDRDIGIFWSGGIDSTTALVALMQTCPQWSKRLQIFTSRYAIQNEYPWFYQHYLRQARVRLLEPHDFFEASIYTPDMIPVDGACGNQIWGSGQLEKIPELWNKPWKILLTKPEFLQRLGWSNWLPSILNYIEQQVHKFPVPIKTVFDLYWMLAFGHKWDYNRYYHMSHVDDISLFDHMRNFYTSHDLQCWSMANNDKKLGSSWTSYKQPAKDFIFKMTNDSDYRLHKTQQDSLPQTFGHCPIYPKFLAVTDEHHVTRAYYQNNELVHKSWNR